VSVEVLNATGTPGLEEKVAEKLRAAGYKVVGVGAAPQHQEATTFLWQEGLDPAVGKDLVQLLGKGTGKRAPSAQGPSIQVIVGADYSR
jgi:hypothetical protein